MELDYNEWTIELNTLPSNEHGYWEIYHKMEKNTFRRMVETFPFWDTSYLTGRRYAVSNQGMV